MSTVTQCRSRRELVYVACFQRVAGLWSLLLFTGVLDEAWATLLLVFSAWCQLPFVNAILLGLNLLQGSSYAVTTEYWYSMVGVSTKVDGL